MNKRKLLIIMLTLLIAPESKATGKDTTIISEKAIKNLNIEILEVGSAAIQQTINVSGRVNMNQNKTASVKARFAGIIRTIIKEQGELVKAGETLATVESNDSLQVYAVKAPITGTIISRNANVGELASDTLFIITDLSKLWAELFIFSKDSDKLKVGQTVQIQAVNEQANAQSTIALVLPTADSSSQTLVARAMIENPHDIKKGNIWHAGMNIRAEVVLSETMALIAVKNEAIQRLNGEMVVFVAEENDIFKAQPVEIGLSDAHWTEIKSGLSLRQNYVAKGSFVVKADIGKAGIEEE